MKSILGVARLVIVSVAFCLVLVSQAAADAWPTQLACTFDQGTSSSYSAGKFASKAPHPLSFDVVGIDLEGQSAQLRTSTSRTPGQLRVVRAINANHFIEVVNEGFLNLTTIFDADPTTGKHPAVHSRHFGVLGQPVFAQYSGECRRQ